MSYSTPELETNIRARALALAEALSSSHPAAHMFAKARDEFRQDVIAMELPSDTMTWFAMKRVAGRSNVPAVLLEKEGQEIPAGALVLVDRHMVAPRDVNDATIKSLKAAAFVVAPAQWGAVLRQANLNAFRVAPSEEVEPSPPSRPSAPGF